jgi:hypothetical protein
MELEIQKLLRLHGLEYVQNLLKLYVRETGDLVLLKYQQLEADWTQSALYDCRGIILDRNNNWNIVCFPFKKFFNFGEGYGDNIDWNSAVVFDKLDGSIITLYFYNNKWNVATSGTIHAETNASGAFRTFNELFWFSIENMYGSIDKFISKLNHNYNYMFELMTPENIVVTQHTDYTAILHGVRDLTTLKELYVEDFKHIFKTVNVHDFKTLGELETSFKDMTWQEEGYVVRDNNFGRRKIKNPKYVAVHHIKSGCSPYAIIDVIKANELDEYLVYFPENKEKILNLEKNLKKLEIELHRIWINKLNCGIYQTQKEYALDVFKYVDKKYTGIFFALQKGSIKSILQGLINLDNKILYNILT